MENYLLPGNKEVLAGLFSDKTSAEDAYFQLKARGYLASEINVLMSKETHFQYYSDNKKQNNATPFGIANDVISFGSNLKIPWPGLVVSGPLENDFNIQEEKSSHMVKEAILKAGVPKDEVVRFIESLNDGKILITVFSHNQNNNQIPSQKENATVYQNIFY